MQDIHPDPAATGEGDTAEMASHGRRSIGGLKGLGIGALCLVSAGIGAAAVSGASISRPIAPRPRRRPGRMTRPATTRSSSTSSRPSRPPS